MSAEYEEDYFVWLCAKITDKSESRQSYWGLYKMMHEFEFVWIIQGDANRAADGRDLRVEFRNALGLSSDIFEQINPDNRVSVLEVLIALTYHAEFQTGCSREYWFDKFIENLGLYDEYDAGGINRSHIHQVLYSFVWRLYDFNGNGGLFPLQRAPADQRNVELWYQFFEYIESEMIGR